MEWFIMNGAGLRAISTELVISRGEDEWEVCSDASEKLEELCDKLDNEDDRTMAIRRELALSDIIRSQLVALVRICSCERLGLMHSALKALSKLTNPMYLLLTPDGNNVRESDKHALLEDLHRIVVDFHDTLTDEGVMSKIIKHMEMLLDDFDEETMEEDTCLAINNGLLVFRNLLTVRAGTNQWTNEQAHNRIVCSLLNNNFGTLLVNMLLNPNMSKWYMSIAQLISLLFMSQNERDFTLFVLRDDRAKRACGAAVSENGSSQTSPLSFTESSNGSGSDGDGESTAFRCLGAQRGVLHSSVINRDGGLERPKGGLLPPLKRRREESSECESLAPSRSKELHLMEDHPDAASTSSLSISCQRSVASTVSAIVSEDDASARAVLSGDSSRGSPALSKSCCSSPEADSGQAPSPSHISSEEGRGMPCTAGKVTVTLVREVREKLLCFTHDLMRSTAVSKLSLCLQENMLTADKTLAHTIENYLLWLTGLFTKFGTLKDAGWESVSNILSPQLFSYLTYRCTRLMMQVLQTEGNNQQLYLAYIRRLYLACRALHSAIQVIEFFIYKKKHMNKQAALELTNVQTYMLHCRDLRQFFLLAIRNFRPEFMSRLFLNEIIMCNHRYLLVVEELTSQPNYEGPLKMLDHVRQFATLSTMRQYALALDTFETNDKTLNECIFTLMYHVAGDCQQPEVLFQLPLMGLFTKIIESSTSVSQDAMNMIEYVMDRFLELAHLSPELCANFLYTANMAAAENSLMVQQQQQQQQQQEEHHTQQFLATVERSSCGHVKFEVDEAKEEKAEVKDVPLVKSEPVVVRPKGVKEKVKVKKEEQDLSEAEKEKEEEGSEWLPDERNTLISAYFTRCSSKSRSDLMGISKGQWIDDIVEELGDQGVERSKFQVVHELRLLGLLKDSSKTEKLSLMDEEEERPRHGWLDKISTEDLISFIRKFDGGGPTIAWVQQFILEVLYCRLGGQRAWQAMTEFPHPALRFRSVWTHEEPVVFHHLYRTHDIPLAGASEEEERRLCDPHFRELLHRLGFLLPSVPHRIFPIFPRKECESPEKLLEVLRSLGPLPANSKFSMQAITALASQKTSVFTCVSEASSSISSMSGKSSSISPGSSSYPGSSIPSNMWIQLVSMHNRKSSGFVGV